VSAERATGITRSVRVLRNVATNYMRFATVGVVGFVLTPLMVHLLGDGDYGLWVTVFSLTGYFGLFDQGIRPSLVRYVSQHRALDDDEGLNRTINSAFALYTLVGILTLVAAVVVSGQFGHWFHIGADRIDEARLLVLIVGATIALGFPFGVFGAALSGLQRYDVANMIGIAVSIVRAFAFIVVLRFHGGVVGLAWASLAMSLIGYTLSWVYARRLMPGLVFARRYVTREYLKKIGSYGGIAFLGALATSITFQTDSLVITAWIGAASVTFFALAAGLVDNVRTLVHSATWVLSPTASELETRGEHEKLHQMMIAGSMYSVLLSWPPLWALMIFGHNLLTTWVDAQHAHAATLLTILAIPTLISLPQSTTSSVLFGISRHKGVVALSVLNALVNLGLSILWVKPYGLTGVAYGTAIPLGLIGGVATLIYGCRELELPLGRYLWGGIIRPGLASIAFVIPALAVQWLFHPMGWLGLGTAVCGSWLVFAATAWGYGLTPIERRRWGRVVPGLFKLRDPAVQTGR
jgi:O-antigen/teichoic acid export membrane protein